MIAPPVVIRPMAPMPGSVNHRIPPAVATIPEGSRKGEVALYSMMTPVLMFSAPILFPTVSVNQSRPSGPSSRSEGSLVAVGMV